LLHQPGGIKAIIKDANNDKMPDVWVLMGQGNEGIFLFLNKGNNLFEQTQVLRFPAIYGSSSFELNDFNKDGYTDILYTCGDNADITPIFKPYHGVYIFLNNGSNHFSPTYFYPLYGCYKAMAADFDNDNDLDIATISYFADFVNQPASGFVYFENIGDLDFTPYMIPGTSKGRWVTMDIGDMDEDGNTDIVLGNFAAPLRDTIDLDLWTQSPAILALRNRGKNSKGD
jgi:hypothetical protein